MPRSVGARPQSDSPLLPIARVAAAALVAACAGAARAQWTVVSLAPVGSGNSYGYALIGQQQAGIVQSAAGIHAAVWNGTPASFVDLNPDGATRSEAYATSGDQQAGDAVINNHYHASVWSGTAASWVDLHPASASDSYLYATNGTQQGGWVYQGSVNRASLWSGTAASRIDLHPNASHSYVLGMSGNQQAGYVQLFSGGHASLWTGTAASWTDLNPSGSSESVAYATTGTHQVGFVNVAGVRHAALWSGTAASWVDLHPPTAGASYALAAYATQQAGYVLDAAGNPRASLWTGSAASWVDLATLLPPGYALSYAYGIWNDGVNTFVCGYAYHDAPQRYEALLWMGPCGPTISQQPQSGTTCPAEAGGVLSFSVAAVGAGPFTYEWQIQTAPGTWTDLTTTPLPLDCGGSATATTPAAAQTNLAISPCPGVNSYPIRCLVANACGAATSNTAQYIVCAANCDCSTASPALNVNDFACFLARFASGDPAANCDHSTDPPVLNVNDFACFLSTFAAGCP